MQNGRTDLATELHELHTKQGDCDGIEKSEATINGIRVSTVVINKKGEALAAKPAGNYITADIGLLWQSDRAHFKAAAELVSELIGKLLPPLPSDGGCVLIVGLGNEHITPDSIGPKTTGKIVVTRHIKKLNRELYESAGFGCSAAFAPGVLGQTGIESAEIISSVVKTLKPHAVIVIDALASRRLSRLATTVQLSDSGIAPGSGVCNSRSEISKKTLGVPTVSIGVPTVVDAATLAFDLLCEAFSEADAEVLEQKLLGGRGKDMFVSPKESDVITDELSSLLAAAINLYVHPEISLDELSEYSGR